MITPIKKGIYKIEFCNAKYSYEDKASVPRGSMVACGRIKNENSKLIELEMSWTDSLNRSRYSMVFPKPREIKRDQYVINDIVAIYWSSYSVYENDYRGKHVPKSYVTEGKLIRESEEYVIIQNPLTLDIDLGENAPTKIPNKYFIPKSVISEIRFVKK